MTDLQWVCWNSRWKGKPYRTKWHAREGFSRETLCGRKISPIDSIPMERPGAYQRDKPPKNPTSCCPRCLKQSEKLNEQLELGE